MKQNITGRQGKSNAQRMLSYPIQPTVYQTSVEEAVPGQLGDPVCHGWLLPRPPSACPREKRIDGHCRACGRQYDCKVSNTDTEPICSTSRIGLGVNILGFVDRTDLFRGVIFVATPTKHGS
ncbi:hypothetical protein BO86DRAFT_70480 [Aspergillus japonicus CBS 114.51]|uniref:Uncharacterized protein n=1 Tax=Aspergillus japonicus CBS 114.51 TaxID=1448312 RepID=A0A8T8X4U2_ASPJA|nr:hypothetical protein BO86DRAFT_70480 [Aspergillus japonicus CBS 114.51]RAH82539.1 hypothetical protein BO86DRAFT_70480 [Aspergillus japonicus CBS 114.51]